MRASWLAVALALAIVGWGAHSLNAPRVALTDDRLVVDGKSAPFLFGAEVQYFRARGGPSRNVPPSEVQALWKKLAARVHEAGMNTVTLYVPWDFHEPQEGTFDFTGTLDRDGDGRADYPSRNLRGFLDLLIGSGIRTIMIRPGPYINAEWGPEGFGAIPRWFLDRYPDSLAKTKTPGKPRVVNFSDPVFRDRSATWIRRLHAEVLKDYIGPGKPVVMLQIDNETNYFWDSVYERDHSPRGIQRYREWARLKYGTVEALNAAYGSKLSGFTELNPPTAQTDRAYPGARWHYDWYEHHDAEIKDYYEFLRRTWHEVLGDSEKDLLFTSCDSFNVLPLGLLPRLDWRQQGRLTHTTMNIYPKTYGTQAESTLNTPMKAAHDAMLVAASHRQFYGAAGNWVMSTETVGGWFPPVEVSLATRQHTYGSLLGSGVKAMIIYYFHEGWNWDGLEAKDTELHFDAPLDKNMEPRAAFGLLKEVGRALAAGLGDLAVRSTALPASVLVAHHNAHQYPIPGAPDASKLASTDSAALFGLFREAGAMPDVAYLEAMSDAELRKYRLVIWQNAGYLDATVRSQLERYVAAGGTLLWIGDGAIAGTGAGKVVSVATNPADGWNDDRYGKIADAAQKIAWAKDLLAGASISPVVRLQLDGDEPYVHAWARRVSDEALLVSVENFSKRQRRALARFDASVLPQGEWFTLSPALAAEGAERLVVSREKLTREGVTLTVRADGVDLWRLDIKR